MTGSAQFSTPELPGTVPSADNPLGPPLNLHKQIGQPRHVEQLRSSATIVDITVAGSPSTPEVLAPQVKVYQVAAKSTPPRTASASGVRRPEDRPLPTVTPQKLGCWEKVKACFSCCPCFKPAEKKLEDAAFKEISSKIIKGATITMRGPDGLEEVPWDYGMIAHDMQNLADTLAIGGTRSDTLGEKAIGQAIVNKYKKLAAACPPKNDKYPNDKRTALEKELVYRTIQLQEFLSGGYELGSARASNYAQALRDAAKNFDGNEEKQLELLRNILKDPKFQKDRVLGTIQPPLYHAICRELGVKLEEA